MQEPVLRVWMQDSVPPTTYYHERPGRWIGESSWPSENTRERTYTLAWPGVLNTDPVSVDRQTMTIQSPLSVGLFAGKWCSYAATPDLPHDQREEDGGALVFTSQPLKEPLEILGAPEVELDLRANRPVAMVAIRLSDVQPDDQATRVTYGLLNLTHRDGSAHPSPLIPGKQYRVKVRLNHIAQRFPAGNRLRLSISTSYWPLAWPPPEPVRLTIETGTSRLVLPQRHAPSADADIAFAPAEGAPVCTKEQRTTPHHNWRVVRDLAADISTLEVINDDGTVRFPDLNLDLQRRALEWYRYQGMDFCSARGETLWERGFRRGDWSVRTVTRTVLTSTATHFQIHAQLDAFEGERRVYAETWSEDVGRDLV
jgi:predicted acyl esterase